MRAPHVGVRLADLVASTAFYEQVGYVVVGRVDDTPIGDLVMCRLPEDPFVTLELVSGRGRHVASDASTLSHLVAQVEDLDRTVAELAERGVHLEVPAAPGDPRQPRTAWVTDPDGNGIELVQWPQGHAVGMTEADFIR